jgi:hypothetical protein
MSSNRNYPTLTPSDLSAAWAYYEQHREEGDRAALLLPLMRTGMVKLYSNENFPMDIVSELRRLGYDVLTSYDAGQANQGIPDEDVLAFATQQERAVEYGKHSATTYHP